MSERKLPYYSSFSSVIKPVVSEEKDRLLACASLQELSSFIPNIDTEKNIDLLPVAFDACVINRRNKNGDLVNTTTALATYKSFIHKFIDVEHSRDKIIGVILTASLSEFATNRPLKEEDVIGGDFIFNITLGGVLWRAVNPKLCDLIEESNDPTSENFMKVSASWELGFSEYKILESEPGKKNFSEATIITDPELINNIRKYLKCFGGSGVKNNKEYSRLICGEDVVAMGVGLTENPAADVKGISVPKEESEKIEIVSLSVEQQDLLKNTIANTEIISQAIQNNVKRERESIMKITSISDITDDNLKQCSASVVAEFIQAELKKANEVFVAEKTEQATANQKLKDQTETLAKTISEMKASIEALQAEKEARAKVDAFNSRMNEVCATYELPEDVTKVVVEDLKALASDEAFAAWKTKAETLLKPYSKAAIAEAAAKCKAEEDAKAKKAAEDEEDDENEEKECKASTNTVVASVENALDNADKEKAGMPNSSSASAPGLKERYAAAFAEENFVIKFK